MTVPAVEVSQRLTVCQTTVEGVMPGGTMMMMRRSLTSVKVCVIGIYTQD